MYKNISVAQRRAELELFKVEWSKSGVSGESTTIEPKLRPGKLKLWIILRIFLKILGKLKKLSLSVIKVTRNINFST